MLRKGVESMKKDQQQRVLELLQSGGHFSVIDIAVKAHVVDPRSVIRNLRKQGITVYDEWVNTETSSYKRFWIEPLKQGKEAEK